MPCFSLSHLADGRSHLTGVGLLAPHLVEDTAEALLAGATHKTKAEIEALLASRFPRPDLLAWVSEPPGGRVDGPEHAPAHVGNGLPDGADSGPDPVEHAPAHVADPVPFLAHPRVKPLSGRIFEVQLTLGREGRDLLRRAQALLAHEVPGADIATGVERALGLLVQHLERRKFAATARPATRRRPARRDTRHIPAHVRRAVWERDGGRCTFVSDAGHRCEARSRLEFDHVVPFARDGEADVDGIRLLCRAHNQFEAEWEFGADFMRHRRIAASGRRAPAHVEEVVPWLR